MAKVTSKLQLTLPKAIAVQYGIEPGAEVDFVPAGDVIRLVPGVRRRKDDVAARLRRFDAASARLRTRTDAVPSSSERGWTRDDLYDRPRSR